MLQNKVYLGDEFYPALITIDEFERAADARSKKAACQKRYKNDDYEYREPLFAFSAKLFCGICGSTFYRFQVKKQNKVHSVQWKCRNFKEHNENGILRQNVEETELEDIFITVLHDLAKDIAPLLKKPADKNVVNTDIDALSREITELLETPQKAIANKEYIKNLIAKRAYLQYERACIDDFDYQTGKINRMLVDKDLMDKTFDADFFRGVIKRVELSQCNQITFEFLNGYKVFRQYEKKAGGDNDSKKC